MKIESTAFGKSDLEGFLDGFMLGERDILVERLERAQERTAALGARLPEGSAPGTDDWNAVEVMAHIAVLSKFYSFLLHRIGRGQLTEYDLLPMITVRDVQGEEQSRRPPAELTAQAVADQERALGYLRVIGAEELRRSCAMGGGVTMTAADVARMPLVLHLEQHLDQLEAALG